MKKLTLISIVCMFASLFVLVSAQDDFVEMAKTRVEAAIQPSDTWTGPTTGPTAPEGLSVVLLVDDLRNGGHLGVSNGVEEAAEVLGWNLRTIDAGGSISGRTSAFNQAIALRPDGILTTGFDIIEQAVGYETAEEQGIPTVGWHVAPNPGPAEGSPIFANVTTNSNDVAEVAALFAVAQSNGTAKAVIFTDSRFGVAVAKSDAMAAVLEQCEGCEVLSTEDTPLNEVSTRMPQVIASLFQRHGDDLSYMLGINDLYFDFGGPALASAGKDPAGPPFNLSAGDGSESAYQRIRDNEYQAGTVPEPLNLHGWQLLDELNRAIAGESWSGYETPVHLVTPDNIAFDGGPDNVYDPGNGYRDEYKSIWGR